MSNRTEQSSTRKEVSKAHAFDPTTPALTQPWKSLVGQGYITSLNVEFTPMGVTVTGKADARLAANASFDAGVATPIQILLASAVEKNLVGGKSTKTKKGKTAVAQPKPSKTLVLADFDLTQAEFDVRLSSVMVASGAAMLGRVRTKFSFEKSLSFRQWWKESENSDKLVAVTDGKNFTKITTSGKDLVFLGDANFRTPKETEALEFRVVSPQEEDNKEESEVN